MILSIKTLLRKLFIITFSYVFLQGCHSPGDDVSKENLKQWMSQNGKIKVLSTTAMINDIVRQIGKDNIDTLTLIQGQLDPHSYQLVKGDDEKLAAANIIFYNGLGLEHGPSLRGYLANNQKAVALGDKIRNEDQSFVLHYNGSLDPHIWMNIAIWEKIIPHIVDKLSQHDPTNADVYRENGKDVQRGMREMHKLLKEKMASVPEERRYLVTSHDAFNYFTKAYLATESEIQSDDWQKRFAAPEGLAPESQLSPAELRLILDHVKEYNVHVIFPEASVSQASIRKLINAGLENGLTLCIVPEPLYSDTLGAPGSSADTYLKMIQHNVDTMIKYFLLNKCDE